MKKKKWVILFAFLVTCTQTPATVEPTQTTETIQPPEKFTSTAFPTFTNVKTTSPTITDTPTSTPTPKKKPSITTDILSSPEFNEIIYPETDYDLIDPDKANELSRLRENDFIGSLKFTLEIISIENYSTKEYHITPSLLFTVKISLKNISTQPIIISKPRNVGIDVQFDFCFNIFLKFKDLSGIKVNFNLWDYWFTYYICDFGDSLFYLLEPEEIYVKEDSVVIRRLYDFETGIFDLLPPGNYIVFAEYFNHTIGDMVYPLNEGLTAQEKDNFRKIADFNAWVGILQSNEVEIIIPGFLE